MSIGKNWNAISKTYWLRVNSIMKTSLGHMVEHLDNLVVVPALLCLGSHTLPGGSLATAPQAPPRRTDRHMLLLLLPSCNHAVQSARSPSVKRQSNSIKFKSIHSNMTRLAAFPFSSSADPQTTTWAPPPHFPLFPLISDSLECSRMTPPCQSQHH